MLRWHRIAGSCRANVEALITLRSGESSLARSRQRAVRPGDAVPNHSLSLDKRDRDRAATNTSVTASWHREAPAVTREKRRCPPGCRVYVVPVRLCGRQASHRAHRRRRLLGFYIPGPVPSVATTAPRLIRSLITRSTLYSASMQAVHRCAPWRRKNCERVGFCTIQQRIHPTITSSICHAPGPGDFDAI
jgi:hypothetical protein